VKILLANSPFQYFHTTSFYHPDWGALNLAQLAAMVDAPGNEIRLVDNWHPWWKSESIVSIARAFGPDMVGISNSTDGDTESILEVVRRLRQEFPGLFLVAGGEAAHFKHDYLLREGFDAVVMGEGEYAFRELVAAKNAGADWHAIAGLAYLKNGGVVRTTERPFIKNLDELPFPARHLMPRFRSIFFPDRMSAEIETARGCCYGCDYCSITAFWKRTLRKKSNDRIMEELWHIKNDLGASQVYFIDDVFGVEVKEYTELFKRMVDEKIDIKWFTQIRPDTIAKNPDMIAWAARSGFFGALVGFEAYNDDILKGVGKVGSAALNQEAARVFRANKIVIFGVHMFNIPGQTVRDYWTTYLQGRRNSDIFRLSMFSPIPGTPIFDRFKKEGLIKQHDERQYPYAYYIEGSRRSKFMVNLMYYGIFLVHYFHPWTILTSFFHPDRLMRRMKVQAYIQNFRYVMYIFLRAIGLKVL
jgi:anaerobic magnesium-protoporphyrin IX monomethyl ester cyclase